MYRKTNIDIGISSQCVAIVKKQVTKQYFQDDIAFLENKAISLYSQKMLETLIEMLTMAFLDVVITLQRIFFSLYALICFLCILLVQLKKTIIFKVG